MSSNNLSKVSDEETASTSFVCALQRAENLAILGVKSVTELCVGPSLRTLEMAYARYGIAVSGNDIDPRWKKHYPKGIWIVSDALDILPLLWETTCVVFAPPLSRGCTGRREDSLMINEVTPKYTDFLKKAKSPVLAMVLPARSLATRDDRSKFYELVNNIEGDVQVVPLVDGCVKYYDVYIDRRNL